MSAGDHGNGAMQTERRFYGASIDRSIEVIFPTKKELGNELSVFHQVSYGCRGATWRWKQMQDKRGYTAICAIQRHAEMKRSSERSESMSKWRKNGQHGPAPKIPPPVGVLCTFCVRVKYSCKNAPCYILTKSIAHSCNGLGPAPRQGMRNLQFSPMALAQKVKSQIKNDVLQTNTSLGKLTCFEALSSIDGLSSRDHSYTGKRAKELVFGNVDEIFMTSVSRIENLKKNDPDTKWFFVFYPDYISKQLIEKPGSGRKIDRNLDDTIFCLRLHGILCSMGSSRRRKVLKDKDELLGRNMRATDFCHAYGPTRGCIGNIVNPGPDKEILLDAFTIEAENECQNTSSRLFEVDRYGLGESKQPIVGDRMKGQEKTLSFWCPKARKDHCTTHLEANMEQVGGADANDLLLFRNLVHEKDPGINGALFNKNALLGSKNEKFVEYMKTSIFGENCGMERFVDAYISSEREGIRTLQLSESLNGEYAREPNLIRGDPMPIAAERIWRKEVCKMKKEYDKYSKYAQKGLLIPPKYELELKMKTVNPRSYHITMLGPMRGSVQAMFESSDHKEHTIDISNGKFQCSFGCLKLDGQICSQGHVFIAHCNMDSTSFVPKKNKVTSGIELFNASKLDHDIAQGPLPLENLSKSNVPILMPHVRKPKGRTQKRRMRKGQKQKSYLYKKHEKAVMRALDNNEPIPELPLALSSFEKKCTSCGQPGHYSSTCSLPHNGRGDVMSNVAQEKALKQGYLLFEIKEPGKNNLPSSYDEFQEMRKKSPMSSQVFQHMMKSKRPSFMESDGTMTDNNYNVNSQNHEMADINSITIPTVIIRDSQDCISQNEECLMDDILIQCHTRNDDVNETREVPITQETLCEENNDGNSIENDSSSSLWSLMCSHCMSGEDVDVDYDSDLMYRGIYPANVCTDLERRKVHENSSSFNQMRNDVTQWFDSEAMNSMQAMIGHYKCIQNMRLDYNVYVSSALFYDTDSILNIKVLPTLINRIIGSMNRNNHYASYEMVIKKRIVIIYDGMNKSIQGWSLSIDYILKKHNIDLNPNFQFLRGFYGETMCLFLKAMTLEIG